MLIHTIWRNGRLYDRLNSDTHAVTQIALSNQEDMPDDIFEVKDENGELYYSIGPYKKAQKETP
jgi:hypothetical protein